MDPKEIERRFTKRVKDFVCFNTHLRIVNQIIYKEFIFGLWNKRKNWQVPASERLKREHGIEVAPSTLKSHLLNIKNGKRSGIAASDFTAGISYESSPLSRYEKDALHARMEMLVYQFIDGPTHYVGLPANQIIAAAEQYDNVVACEKDYLMSRFMFDMDRHINKRKNVSVENKDVLDFLEHTNKEFNIFEFDFMGIVTPELIERMVWCVKKTSMDRALIAIVSVGGRKITIKEYKSLMPQTFISELEDDEAFSVVGKPFSGKYKDHKTPMRYELLIVERKSSAAGEENE
jgi:hypothetical protein